MPVIDLSTLTASQGFVIRGDAAGDRAGWSVSSAGDVNGDGIDDVIVGAPFGDGGGTDAGEACVIHGQAGIVRWRAGEGFTMTPLQAHGVTSCILHDQSGATSTPCIPSPTGRKTQIPHDIMLYRQRHRIENMFARQRTGDGSQPATTAARSCSSPLARWPRQSSTGYESEPQHHKWAE